MLDYKANVGTSVVPVGGPIPNTPSETSNDINLKGNFSVTPIGFNEPLINIDNTGIVSIGNSNSDNNIVFKSSVRYQYKNITDDATEYTLGINDFAIDINSDTYITIKLPSALNIGGKKYLISRGEMANNNLVVEAQPGETIDGIFSIPLDSNRLRLEIISNNIDTWYLM